MDILYLQGIAQAGGSIDISATKLDFLSLQTVAIAGKTGGAQLIIRDAIRLSSLEAKAIASKNPGKVTFVF